MLACEPPKMWLFETLTGAVTWAVNTLADKASGSRFLASLGFFLFVCLVSRVMGGLVWTRTMLRSAGASIGIALVNFVVYPIILATSSGELTRGWELLHVPRLPASTWQELPTWLVAIVAVVAYDFANYWNHRLMHWKWLWPVHAIHHSDPEVTALTTHRVHPFEGIVMWTSYLVLLSWLGLPPGVIGGGALVIMLHNQYVHVNVDWNHGPLWFLVASPRFHRWHHADVAEAHGKNLANIFPVWDVLFGTYYNPGPCRARVGAEGVPENDVVKLMLFPLLAWARLVAAVGGRLSV
jgi:sterol desaturase/sphingolipid hydroxylase (fatty acid hydroxylase superfamily)